MLTTEQDIRAALLAGGVVTVDPAVTIDLTTPLEVTVPGTRVHGGRYRAHTGPAWRVTADDVVLADLTIEGGRACDPTYDPTQRLIHAVGQQGAPLRRVVVRDCTIRESRGDAVRLEWCEDPAVHDCRIAGVLYAGVMVISGLRVRIHDCTIVDGPLSDGVANTYGISFTDLTNDETGRSRDCSASDCTVVGFGWKGLDTHSGDGVVFADNTIIDCTRGIAAVGGNATRLVQPSRISITGNRIDARGLTNPGPAVTLAGLANRPADGVITGQQVVGYDTWLHHEYVDRARLQVAANSHPHVNWMPLDMSPETASEFWPNATYPPEVMGDGGLGAWRGGIIPKAANAEIVGRLPSPHLYPDALTWVAYTRGSNANAGGGMLTIHPDGLVRLLYRHGTDTYTRPLVGTWRAA